VLPGQAIELVAAPAGVGPDVAGASPPVVVRRDPATPRVVASGHDEDLLLQVEAAESGGAIVVEAVALDATDPAGTAVTLARVDVAARADLAPSPVEIVVPDARGVALRVVQIDPDGRRSPSRAVFVDAVETKQE
jgi:hypothetical protein